MASKNAHANNFSKQEWDSFKKNKKTLVSANNPVRSEVLYSKIISKHDKTGKYFVGSLKIEIKQLLEAKFIQLTQEKAGFAGSPSKISTLTLDLSNKEVRDSLIEAIDLYSQLFQLS